MHEQPASTGRADGPVPDAADAVPSRLREAALADAAALGLPMLSEVLANVEDGVLAVDVDGRLLYANPAACRLLGRSADVLRGCEFLQIFESDGGAELPGAFPWNPDDAPTPFRCVVGGPDTLRREVTCSVFCVDSDGAGGSWLAIRRETGGEQSLDRTAQALEQITAQLVSAGTVEELLRGIARRAVESTSAVACGIVVVGEDHKLSVAGGFGFPSRTRSMRAWTASSITLEELPGGALVSSGKPVVLLDARAAMAASPATKAFGETMAELDWKSSYFAPLSWDGEVFGVLGVHLPSAVAGPTAQECAFYGALANQSSVAVTNARLAASIERTRLARELHDSISQALFSMTMHARAAQLAMSKAGLDETGPLGRSVAQLAELTRGTLAEMRALIFELRPGALAEEGLVSALRKQAAALTAREQVEITVDGPEQRLELGSEVEEHLYRITVEALNNVVKHARAEHATVLVTAEAGALRIVVSDDGVGFDPDAERTGSMGLSGMSERAHAVGAELSVTSTLGAGSTVTVALAHTRRNHAPPESEENADDAR